MARVERGSQIQPEATEVADVDLPQADTEVPALIGEPAGGRQGFGETARLTFQPTTDDADFIEAMTVSLLARAAQIELTDRLREQLGQAYSPDASSSMSSTYPGYGTFTITASVDAGQVEATRAAIAELVDHLRDAPLDEDVITRARQPMLESYDNALKSLGGWLNLADRAQSEAERLERWFAGPDTLKAITAQDLQEAAQRYLARTDAVEFLVLPREASPGDVLAE